MNNSNFYDDPIQYTRALPERVAYFRFYDYIAGQTVGDSTVAKPTVLLNGLNVKFRIQQIADTRFAGGNSGEFGICNLSSELMKDLANIYEVPKSPEAPGYRRVQFYAGYKNATPGSMLNDVSLLFDGFILKTHVSSMPPDVWFDFRAFTYLQGLQEQSIVNGGKPIDFKQAVTFASTACGFATPIFVSQKTVTLKTFRISGTAQDIIRQLEQIAALNHLKIFVAASTDSKIQLIVVDTFEDGNANVLGVPGRTEWLVSEQNGMIGVPEMSFGHATVTVQFNPHIRPLDFVTVKSALTPYWNGKFYAARIEHFGELRGRDFCTRLDLFKVY